MDQVPSRFDIPQEEQVQRQQIRKQGMLILGAIVAVTVVFMGGILYVSYSRKDASDQANTSRPVPTVTLETVYENPFTEEAEYSNPFASAYENPFEGLE